MDPMSKMMELYQKKEELHPDLVPYLEKCSFGLCVRHPLIYSVFYTPQMNAYLNEGYKAKKEYTEKKLAEKEYSSYIWLHERPYRLERFVNIQDDLSDKEYWSLLGSIWSDSENLWQYGSALGFLIDSPRPGRENMMDEDETKLLADLPDEFLVYRGHQVRNRLGYSWTLSYWRAKWFAQRFQQNRTGVVAGIVKRKDVVAVLLGRNEFEIVCHPDKLESIHTISKTRKRVDWVESIARKVHARFTLSGSVHGPWHWEKVEKNGLALAKATPKCDTLVVQLFSLIHDSQRENDDHDPDHGKRAAAFARQLHKQGDLKISTDQLEVLVEACANHNDGKTSNDPTIGVCWDADRLDLTRVGMIPDPNLLSTKAGKELLWKI